MPPIGAVGYVGIETAEKVIIQRVEPCPNSIFSPKKYGTRKEIGKKEVSRIAFDFSSKCGTEIT
jgi:hypothetical protein